MVRNCAAAESETPYPLMEDKSSGQIPDPKVQGDEEWKPSLIGASATSAEIDYYGLALVFLAPALGGFLYGYDIGATSFVVAMMRNSRDGDNWWHHFSSVEQGLFVSSVALGALMGSHLVLVYLAKSIGRRKEIRVAATLYVVGAMLNIMSGTALAYTRRWVGMGTLLAGRIFFGAGVGFTMHGAPTYMAEMSPSTVRGTMVSAKETVIVFGIVVGMLMGDLMSDYPDNWTDLYNFEILGALPMLFLTFRIPRSKRWLLMKGYKDEAKKSMQFVYKGDVDDEFEKMADTIGALCCRSDCVDDDDENDADYRDAYHLDEPHSRDQKMDRPVVVGAAKSNTMGRGTVLESRVSSLLHTQSSNEESENDSLESSSTEDVGSPSLTHRRYRGIITTGIALLVCLQASGQPSILAYNRVLFETAGFTGHTSVTTVLIMGFTSSMTVSLVDRVGRKILLLSGAAIMICSLLTLAVGFWTYSEENYHLAAWQKNMVLWSMFVYIAGYQVGYGPITWTVLSEIYPSEIRGTAMALSVEVNFFFKFLVQFCFPAFQEFFGWKRTFLTFACLGVIGFIFIWSNVPETKGLSLEEIQVKLRGEQQDEKLERNERPLDMALLQKRDKALSKSTSDQSQLNPIV